MNNHIKNKKIAQIIPEKEIFDRKDLLRYSRKIDPEFLDTSVRNLLEYLLKSGKVARVGRNQYIKILKFEKSQKYSYHYSKESKSIMKTLQSRYPHLEYRVWELSWLNEFLNHQIAQNKIFIEVESIGCEYVFEELNKEYKGKILLKPNSSLFLKGKSSAALSCLLTNTKFDKNISQKDYFEETLPPDSPYKRLEKIKKIDNEAYGYIVEAVRLIEQYTT